MGATAVKSESKMGEGHVPMKVSRHIYVFSVATNDIRRFGGVPASAGIVDRKDGYVD
jgi:hypothetical protein